MRFVAFLLFIPIGSFPIGSLASAAQPSPKVDQSLRARINEFYELQVNRQFRQAEDLIAQDSKEFYYESKKPDIKSFSIDKIEYSPGLKTAVASIRAKVEIIFGGAPPMVVESVSPSNWKIEKGKWCWYFDKEKFSETPFGKAHPQTAGANASPPDPRALFQSTAAAAMKGAVQPDKQRIQLDAAHPAPQTIQLKNVLPGGVSIKAVNAPAGVNVVIAKQDLGPTESTAVTITPVEGTTERPAAVVFQALPMNQTISIGIDWAPAAK